MSSKLKIDTRVRSLKAYLDEFEQGVFEIPSFQRDFLWTLDDIKQLFDSIKNNFPIGSILFWKPLQNFEAWRGNSIIGCYKVNRKQTTPIYILDGYQRLSSLFGCLINPNKFSQENLKFDNSIWKRTFNLFYDLESEEFVYLRSNNNFPFQIPVYVFMNSIDFRQYARKNFETITDENKIELYYDRADKIGQIFNNYQIASVDINYASIEEAVEIFWRVNAKGVTISKDWIVSALTNNENFRLGTEIDNLLNDLKQYNYDTIKRDVIFQCIQNSFGKIYFDYKIEELVKRPDFIKVTKKTIESIKRAVKFLYEYLLVFNRKLIPYNGQLIFITSFFNSIENKEITEKQILELKKWFWITTYSNYFTIYSLSDQRKAFEQFNAFIEDENINPVYNNLGEENEFTVLNFPEKINMGSVRAKALALFMINYAYGINNISVKKIDSEEIEKFELENLFTINQKDNVSENFLPIITKRIISNDKIYFSNPINSVKKQKNYSELLNENNDNLFINNKIVELNKSQKSEKEILDLRKTLIINKEKEFVNSLGLEYSTNQILNTFNSNINYEFNSKPE